MLALSLLLFAQGGCLVVTHAAPSPQQRRSICSLVLFVTQQPYRRPFEALDERLMHRLHASKPKQSWCPALRSVPDICGCNFCFSTSPQAGNGPGACENHGKCTQWSEIWSQSRRKVETDPGKPFADHVPAPKALAVAATARVCVQNHDARNLVGIALVRAKIVLASMDVKGALRFNTEAGGCLQTACRKAPCSPMNPTAQHRHRLSPSSY